MKAVIFILLAILSCGAIGKESATRWQSIDDVKVALEQASVNAKLDFPCLVIIRSNDEVRIENIVLVAGKKMRKISHLNTAKLLKTIDREHSERAIKQVILRAERTVHYATLVKAMEAIKAVGITQIALGPPVPFT